MIRPGSDTAIVTLRSRWRPRAKRNFGNQRGLHRQAGEARDHADEQGVGGKVQEVRAAGRRQRTQEELPWRAQGVRRGRGLFGLHRGADDGDVRSKDAGALLRQSEPGQACVSGMERSRPTIKWRTLPIWPTDQNRIVTFESNRRKNS